MNAPLRRTIYSGTQPLAVQVPFSANAEEPDKHAHPEKKYVLSRFAFIRKKEDLLVLECPLSHSRIELHHPVALTLLYSLRNAVSLQDISTTTGIDHEVASGFLNLLLSTEMVSEADENGESLQDNENALQSWEFHDLLFHSRSRGNRHDQTAGGTFRLAGKVEPEPILKPMPDSITTIQLFRPNLEVLQTTDPPYARIQDERCSVREYGQKPITDKQLGEFLFRVARLADDTRIETPDAESFRSLQFPARPYPSAGGLYEQEVYVIVNQCQNLGGGLYYYAPDGHQLVMISAMSSALKELIQDASKATTIPAEKVQILFIITARFQRLAWKYSTLAYAAMLKNLGVLYQTMYLAATAMSLAPCAVGYGNSDLFAKTAGTNYYAETSIGEFLLGSKE